MHDRLLRKLIPFWRFQIIGWTAFSISMMPIYFWIEGSMLGALSISIIADGTGFLITWGIRQIFQKFWPAGMAYVIGFVAPICGFAAALQIGAIYAAGQFFEVNSLDVSASEQAFRLFYGRSIILIAWCLLYLGIRSLIDDTRRKMRREVFLEHSPRHFDNA